MTPFAAVDVTPVAEWLSAIPFEDWPQQSRTMLKPAMVTDRNWHEFGAKTDAMVAELIRALPGCSESWRALSAVMPGHAIETHQDQQPEQWRGRVHVPILSNSESLFIIENLVYRMFAGLAYMVDTRDSHAIVNAGETARVHLMFDICQ